MDEDLEQFIRDQKVKLAQERCSVQQQDPPYMEMRRGHDPAMKENIPPPAQQKDNGGSVSLPLGVEYDQKKQRLQHELRMDYRRHMAQRSNIEPAGGASHTLSQRREVKETSPRLPSRRDASTLTERSGRPDEDEEEEEEEEEELWRDRRAHRPPQRSTRDHPEMGGAKAGRRSRALTNKDEAEFTTGLLIGRNETDSAVQRRKDRYRMELQEQIAEQRRNRKREKDLELRVAATGATDPEKQPDRIKQFGLSRRRIQRASDPASPQQREPAPPEQSRPPDQLRPPEQPRPAFQSPLLDCVCCELCPHSHTPRLQLLVPHPPSSVPDTCRSVYEGPYHHHQYYNTTYRPPPADHQRQPPEPHRIPPDLHRPPPDPSLLYYGQLPMSYLTVPPGGGVSSQLGHHSPQSHHEPSIRVDSVTEPVLHAFSSENKSSRTSLISYKEALKQQIEERAERRRQEKEQADRYDAQLEEDMRRHEPWGRGGGGAPLRDSTGNLITDLKQMHRLNEEAYSKPDQYRTRLSRMTREEPRIDPNDRVSGFAHVQMPHFGRGNVFSSPPTAQHVQEQDSYKTYLKQQIEEKRLQASEERERARLEEEKEERRLEEQRARIQKEFLEEQEKKKRKEMEQKAKNEELVRLAEERRREDQRMRRDEEDKENTALRREYERERQARLEEVHREPSPPIPTLQRRHGARHTPRPPSAHSLSGQPPSTHSPRPPSTHLPSTHTSPRPPPSSTHSQLSSAPLSERCLSGLQSPPVPARRNQLRAAEDNRGVFSELSALRRQLYSEQKRLEEWEEHDPLMDRRRDRPLVDVFDRARLKLQAPVRRPSSKHTEPLNLMNIHTSLQLNDCCELPSGEEEVGVTRRRRRGDSSLRTAHSDYVDLSPLHYLRTTDLLESESAFIEPLGPEPSQLSARERRRNRQTQQQQQPIGQADIFTVQSEREAGGKERTRRFQALGRQGPASRSDDDDEGDSASLPISPRGGHAPNPHSSTETLATDPWMQVGGLSRREEGLRARDSVPQDWDT